MPIAETYRQAQALPQGTREPHDGLGYRVPGLITWLVLTAVFIGMVQYPRFLSIVAGLVLLYVTARLVGIVVLNVIGTMRCRAWERRDWGAERRAYSAESIYIPFDDVHHVVIVPSYLEPMSVLERTLLALAVQEDAQRRITVVLAMEETEPDALSKGNALADRFRDRFARILVTLHPARRPGEKPGKGSNQAWAAWQARRELVERLGIPIENLTLTSCDADTVIHPGYFAALTTLFATDPGRYRHFWQSPLFYHNNIWQVPAPTRLLAVLSSASYLARLVSVLARPLPLSTYSLSFKLADEVGYWDPAVISEDWHMFLRCFFAKEGDVALVPIFLPHSLDAVDGETLWRALVNRCRQAIRHAWGAEDMGFILEQWRQARDVPFARKLSQLIQVSHDHLIQSTSWFLVMLGQPLTRFTPLPATTWPGLLTCCSRSLATEMLPLGPFLSHLASSTIMACSFVLIVKLSYIVSGIGMAVVWVLGLYRSTMPEKRWRMLWSALSMVELLLLPVVTFVLGALPALYAQTRLLLGLDLTYRPTPKRIVNVQGEGK